VTVVLGVTLILMASVFHVTGLVLKVSSEDCETYTTIIVLGFMYGLLCMYVCMFSYCS